MSMFFRRYINVNPKTKTFCALLMSFLLGTLVAVLVTGCQRPTATTADTTNVTETLSEQELQEEFDAKVEAKLKAAPAEQTSIEPGADGRAKEADALPKGDSADQAAAQDRSSKKKPASKEEEGTTIAAVDKSANPDMQSGDWTQWGGSRFRNNIPVAQGIPAVWNPGKIDRKTGEWNKEEAVNIKWVAPVGSQTYGNPVVANGRVFVGTNNGNGYLKRYPADVDLGCLIAFDEKDGSFLWQFSAEKLPTGRVHDWPLQGICCSPYVEGDIAWFVSSRGEVICADAEGFYDGEDDGPVTNELGRLFDVMKEESEDDPFAAAVKILDEGKLDEALRERFKTSGLELPEQVEVKADEQGKKWTLQAEVGGTPRTIKAMVQGPRISVYKVISPADKDEADVIWRLDMMNDLGVSQHNMASCSVTALGDILFVCTSNGVDESHINIPAPDAPSFIAVDKTTGEVHWTDKSPGVNILHGQWSSPAVAELGGVPQVIFAGGDSWLYSFRADKGEDGNPELLWKFDCNPKTSKYILGGRGTRNEIIATPVIYDGLVYVAVGQDPEHGEGEGHLWCIDPTKRGDVSPQLAVHVSDRNKPIPHRRLQAVIEEQGETAIDNPNSAVVWHFAQHDQNGDGDIEFHEEMHRSISTCAIKDDLLFVPDFSGIFHCVDAKTGEVYWSYDMLSAAWGSAMIVEDRVYVGDEEGDISVFRLSSDPQVAMKDDGGELVPLEAINMLSSVYSTPIVANGVMYIANRTHLFAIAPTSEAAE